MLRHFSEAKAGGNDPAVATLLVSGSIVAHSLLLGSVIEHGGVELAVRHPRRKAMQAPNFSNESSGIRQLRAAVYVRVSSTHQEREGASLETQEAACRQYCAAKGWLVLEPHIYRETHKRWLLHERPEMTKLREAARDHAFDVVVCYCVDRLSSQDAHVYILDEEFSRVGIRMAFATEEFEQTAIGRFVRSAKVLAAAIEVEKIRERTVRGRIARVRSGKLIPGGKPLYGYRWPDERDHKGHLIKGRLIEDSETASVVRQIFRSLASGVTLRAIAKSLTEDGIPTPTRASTEWQTSSIARIAHQPGYKGKAYGWGIRKGGAQPQHFDPDKAIELPDGTIPPLVDEPTWERFKVSLRGTNSELSETLRILSLLSCAADMLNVVIADLPCIRAHDRTGALITSARPQRTSQGLAQVPRS
jgi:site-specific DNA recombinase